MDEQRLERIETKFDAFYKDFRDFKETTCVRLSEVENDIEKIKACNNEQNKEIKPYANFHWLLMNLPGLIGAVIAVITLLKLVSIVK